ncbi:hypothetical protein 7865G3B6_46 [Haloquadratum phage sp.]|nr:hypothetical protein 7865G3B6_46 [Haloquadratum phage sp.]
MADEGYLIGYEDVNGNFVQIGQFNNAADDVTKPLVLRHTNSGETLELDGSSFRPSTQIGDTNNRPDVFANTVDLNSLVGAGLDTKADLTQSGGVLVASQLPDLAITNIDVVADQTARLALNAEEGDVAIQTDISETFILSTNDPTVNSNWKKVQLDVLGAIDGQTITPAQTGTSTNPTDVEAGNIEAGTIGSSGSRPDLFADEIDANKTAQITTDTILITDQSNNTGTFDVIFREIGEFVQILSSDTTISTGSINQNENLTVDSSYSLPIPAQTSRRYSCTSTVRTTAANADLILWEIYDGDLFIGRLGDESPFGGGLNSTLQKTLPVSDFPVTIDLTYRKA